jgi:hypothetical protein
MKKIFLGLALLCSAAFVNAQNGLESLIVEKYYVSNAADAAGSVGALPVGSVTYRFFVDMLPGYKFQAAYGVPGVSGVGAHTLFFNTTTSFFNNEDRGAQTPTYTKTQAANNTVSLDSWISVGGACALNLGVLKSEDDAVANLVNANGILQNNNASAGIPLTSRDGLLSGSPGTVTTTPGQILTELNKLDASNSASFNSFTLTDGAWSNTAGSTGPTATNRVLIAQITTDGTLTYKLNIQIGTPTGGVQRFVADNAVGAEILFPSLNGTVGAPNVLPSVNITSPANSSVFIVGSTINIAANATDVLPGTVSSVKFYKGATLISEDFTSPYTASYTAVIGTDVLTAVATDDEGGVTTSSAVTISTVANPPPVVNVTSPTNGANFITGTTINISAVVTDNISVNSVEFLVDGSVITTITSNPSSTYATTWVATAGAHTITVRATDNLSAQTSVVRNITVVNNVPPAVTLTSPLSTALFTAPAVVNITANVTDSDGSITLVEFLVNGTVVNSTSSGSSPFSYAWTSTPGVKTFAVRATDNNSGVTTSSPVSIEIADPNALPYRITSSVNTCNPTSFAIPVRALNTVSNVIGYDAIINFDNTKVAPAATNAITVLSDLINPSFVETAYAVNQAAGTINVSLYFNGTAPASTRFTGTGDLFSVQFDKLAGFGPSDAATFTIPFLQESYFTGVQGKLSQSGTYTTYRDTVFTGNLKLWKDNSNLPYNAANPNQYLITNIRGTNASCGSPSATAVQPDLNGQFKYSTNNGLNININKDILSNTDVQAVINGGDALLARRILLNDPTFLPSVYEIVAADVNLDGVVSAGDVSQISQRAVLFIPEFRQAWNYNAAGVSNGQLSKDWLFIDSARVLTNPLYTRSTTYPAFNGTGFNKANVPQVPFCLPVVVSNFGVCPAFTQEFYKGVLIGDISGNVATATPSNLFRDVTDKVIFNLDKAVYANNTVEIPVSILTDNIVNAVDFAVQFDESRLSFNSLTSAELNTFDGYSYFNNDDRTLRFTSSSIDAIQNNVPVAFVKLNVLSGSISSSDLRNAVSYLNGEAAGVEFVGELSTGIQAVNYSNVVSVFPNPANEFVQVLSPESATLTVLDVDGRLVSSQINVIGGQTQKVTTENLASGVYFIRIANDNFSVMKKIVINK